MSSCLGRKKKSRLHDEERQPLLAGGTEHAQDHLSHPDYLTPLQQAVHSPLHTYLMFRALTKGYIPSTKQTVDLINRISTARVLSPANQGLSRDGRRFVELWQRWFKELGELVESKNCKDEVQEVVWEIGLARGRVRVAGGVDRIAGAVARKGVESSIAFASVKTLATLLLGSPDFQALLADVSTILKQTFSDAAHTTAQLAESAAAKIEPSEAELAKLGSGKKPAVDGEHQVEAAAGEIAHVVTQTAAGTLIEATHSLERNTPLLRVRLAGLLKNIKRKEPSYQDAIDTLTLLLKTWLNQYSHAVGNTLEAVDVRVGTNEPLDRAVVHIASILSRFGEAEEWSELAQRVKTLVLHFDEGGIEGVIDKLVEAVRTLLTKPEVLLDEKSDEEGGTLMTIRKTFREALNPDHTVSLQKDLDDLLNQMHTVAISVAHDTHLSRISKTSAELINTVYPPNRSAIESWKPNQAIIDDTIHTLLPLAISAIQHIPIPRVEVLSPDMDLLLENLILYPGHGTINNSSFFPHRVAFLSRTEAELVKPADRLRPRPHLRKNLATIVIQGLTAAADNVGYVLRAHKGILHFSDTGLASFAMDRRGMDIYLDLDLSPSRPEDTVETSLARLRGVRVHIHRLDYTLTRSSHFAWLSWLIKPLLRPLLKRTIEANIAAALDAALRRANVEAVLARERLKGARQTPGHGIMDLVHAVLNGLGSSAPDAQGANHAGESPEDEVDVAIGVFPQVRVPEYGNSRHTKAKKKRRDFEGVYAPGSLVGLMEDEIGEEGVDAAVDGRRERTDLGRGVMYGEGGARGRYGKPNGWRSTVFDLEA